MMIPKIQTQQDLKKYNTFGISALAKYFVDIKDEFELISLMDNPLIETEKLLVLGGGSNCLFTKDFEGLVVKINIKGISFVDVGNEILVTAGAGEVWHEFVIFCVAHGFAGIENLSLIPGTVGASPVQNIGAYGVEIKDVFEECAAIEIKTGKKRIFSKSDCEFSYRESIFKGSLKGKYIISSVTFRLSKTANLQTHYGAIQTELTKRNILNPTIKDISEVVSSIRVEKLPDPSTIGNAGSFFKNPIIEACVFDKLKSENPTIPYYSAPNGRVKLAAGWLIENCGFKGKIEGNTGTWKNQALVIVNHGTASGNEIYAFSQKIINAVYKKYGILLDREVNIL